MSTWNRWCMPTNFKTAPMWTFCTWLSLGRQRSIYSTQTSQRNNHIETDFLVVILILSGISEGMCGYFQEGLTEWQKTLPYSEQILLPEAWGKNSCLLLLYHHFLLNISTQLLLLLLLFFTDFRTECLHSLNSDKKIGASFEMPQTFGIGFKLLRPSASWTEQLLEFSTSIACR